AHLRADGLPAAAAHPHGLPVTARPPCRLPSESARRCGPPVSVVVATCRRPRQLVACVRSVLASDYPRFEVVVVDNAPHEPATRAALTEAFGGESRLHYLTEPVPGTSRARNRGAVAATGELVAFTDDDVEVDPGWLTALVAAFQAEPNVGCVTGLTHPAEFETPAQLWFEQHSGFARGHQRRVFSADTTPPPTRLYPYTCGVFGAGGNSAFRPEVLRGLGGFDVRLGPGTRTHGGEDLDLFLRVVLAGHRVVYEPRALARHHHRREQEQLYRQVGTYGAGATAMLTKWWLRSPELRRLLRRGLLPVLREPPGPESGRAPLPRRLPPSWPPCPPWLAAVERAGHLRGPSLWALAVLLARWGRPPARPRPGPGSPVWRAR
ncbi:MAG TPA: glycosyltransferase, partial [Frankiaceae bacterium]|nr:glycosyltransferase [Frankiaceae bacterium]